MRVKQRQPFLGCGMSLNRGVVGVWPLPEGSGTVTRDLSGRNNWGSLAGGAGITWQNSQYGPVLDFDGSDSLIAASPVTVTAPYSLHILFQARTFPGNSVIFANDDSSGGSGFQLTILTADLSFWAGAAWLVGPTLVADAWYHATIVNLGVGACSMYVDGILAVSGNAGAAGIGDFATTIGAAYHSNHSTIVYELDGQIGMAALWDRELMPNEITLLATDPFSIFQQPLR